MTLITQSFEAVRRSTRIRAQIPFRLVSMDPAVPFSAQCYTLVVNTEGCGVRLTQPLEPGLPVLLDELPGGTKAAAHVANCVPLGTEGKYWLVGNRPGRTGKYLVHPAGSGELGTSDNYAGCPAATTVAPTQESGSMALLSVFQQGRSSSGKEVVDFVLSAQKILASPANLKFLFSG